MGEGRLVGWYWGGYEIFWCILEMHKIRKKWKREAMEQASAEWCWCGKWSCTWCLWVFQSISVCCVCVNGIVVLGWWYKCSCRCVAVNWYCSETYADRKPTAPCAAESWVVDVTAVCCKWFSSARHALVPQCCPGQWHRQVRSRQSLHLYIFSSYSGFHSRIVLMLLSGIICFFLMLLICYRVMRARTAVQ